MADPKKSEVKAVRKPSMPAEQKQKLEGIRNCKRSADVCIERINAGKAVPPEVARAAGEFSSAVMSWSD